MTKEALAALSARCADAYGVPVEAMISDSDQHEPVRVVEARQAVCYLAARYFGASQKELAVFFHRHRSTISHAITVSERRLRADRETRRAVLQAGQVGRNLDALIDEARAELAAARTVVKRLESLVAHLERNRDGLSRYTA